MRIVAGKFRGRKLLAPEGTATRPTTDRTRESLFNILQARMNFEGIRVLDLFAGTGALGLESLSRGASFCRFVDASASAVAIIKKNIDQLGVSEITEVLKRDAALVGMRDNEPIFDLILCDPPYSKGLGEKAAGSIIEGDWLRPCGYFVLEERAADFPEKLAAFELPDERKYGDTKIGLFKRK